MTPEERSIAAENARVDRLRQLDDLLGEFLYLDASLVGPEERDAISRARQIVEDLRDIW